MNLPEKDILKAVKVIKQKYGIVGLDNRYLLMTDDGGDLEICPMGLMEKMYWDAGGVLVNNFVKIKELING